MKKKIWLFILPFIVVISVILFLFVPRKFHYKTDGLSKILVHTLDFGELQGYSPAGIPKISEQNSMQYVFDGTDNKIKGIFDDISVFPAIDFFKQNNNVSWVLRMYFYYEGSSSEIPMYTLFSNGYLEMGDGSMRMHLGSDKEKKALELRKRIEAIKPGDKVQEFTVPD